jgi:hypothetical protein
MIGVCLVVVGVAANPVWQDCGVALCIETVTQLSRQKLENLQWVSTGDGRFCLANPLANPAGEPASK